MLPSLLQPTHPAAVKRFESFACTSGSSRYQVVYYWTSECTDQLAGKDVKLVVLKDVAERPPSINRHNSPFHHFGRSCRQTSAFSEDASDSQGQSPSEMHTTRRYYRGFRTTRRRRGVRTSRPLMHPKVKEMAEQFFEKMRDAQPAQTLTNALTVTKKSFKTNAFSIVRLAIAFSLCNVGYHLIFSGLYAQQVRQQSSYPCCPGLPWQHTQLFGLVPTPPINSCNSKAELRRILGSDIELRSLLTTPFLLPCPQVGGWAWSLCIPVGIFYTIMCMVIVSAISSISSMDETVNIQADNLSEAISQHVAQLEKLTARLEQQEQSPNGKRNQIPPEMIQRLEEKLERALMAAASNGGQDLTAANEVRSVLDELHSWSEELNDSARDSLAKAKRSSNDERESITRSLLAANEPMDEERTCLAVWRILWTSACSNSDRRKVLQHGGTDTADWPKAHRAATRLANCAGRAWYVVFLSQKHEATSVGKAACITSGEMLWPWIRVTHGYENQAKWALIVDSHA
ncbi:MAG: hypothetical protein SGPRY_001107 [Prymnesium sp.]